MLWHDGRIVEGSTVPFDLADRGLLLGDGVFDTALAINGRVAFEAAHVRRLSAACACLGIPADPAEIGQAMRALAGSFSRAAIRTTVTRGPGPRGIAPPAQAAPVLFASAAPARADLAFAPLRLHRSAIRRNETSPTAHLKTLFYLDAVLAARVAQEAGFDEALFLNTHGRIACAGTGNLFAVIEGGLVTPAREEGVLPGIVRAEILRLAAERGLRAEERAVLPEELARAGAVFVTNSLRLIAPVTAIDGLAIPSLGHPLVADLSEALRRSIGASIGAGEMTLA